MSYKRILLLCLLVVIITTNKLAAQNLTLQDAISIALKNNLDIQVLKNNVEISNINNHIGVAGGLPTVSGTLSDNEQVSNINQKLNTGTEIKRNGATGNTLNAGVSSSILLYNGSRVVTTKKRLGQLETQSEQYLNSETQNLAAAVITAYYDVVRQQFYIKTIDRSIEASQKRLDIVKIQQSVGMANNADLYQSQVDLNSLLQSRQSQLTIVDQAKTSLLALMNLRPDSLISISDTIVVDKSIVLGDVLSKLGDNADIIAANMQITINQLISKEVAAQRYPSVRANAAYNLNRTQSTGGQLLLNQNQGPSAGITVAIPIYNGTVFKRQQKVADINTKNAALQKEILLRNYSADIVKVFQSYNTGIKQVETQQKNVELAQKLLDLALYRYELHSATILEVKQAQQSFEDASFTLTNLNFAAKSAEIELRRVSNQVQFQ
jgi:outer membrane protein TolC